jgi:hypothetical protein
VYIYIYICVYICIYIYIYIYIHTETKEINFRLFSIIYSNSSPTAHLIYLFVVVGFPGVTTLLVVFSQPSSGL